MLCTFYQEARPLLLSAHESLIKNKHLLEYLSKTTDGKEHTPDAGSVSENNFVELGTSWRAPFYEITICFQKPHVLGNGEGKILLLMFFFLDDHVWKCVILKQCCFHSDVLGSFDVQKTSFPLFNSIISVEAIDEAEGEFQNRRYILPRGSCFLMVCKYSSFFHIASAN